MNEDLKRKLHRLIDEIEDEETLNMLMEEAVAYTAGKSANIIDELTPPQLEELDEAIKEADRGEGVTLEEFRKEMKAWIKK